MNEINQSLLGWAFVLDRTSLDHRVGHFDKDLAEVRLVFYLENFFGGCVVTSDLHTPHFLHACSLAGEACEEKYCAVAHFTRADGVALGAEFGVERASNFCEPQRSVNEEEALVACLGNFDCLQVGKRYFANVNKGYHIARL